MGTIVSHVSIRFCLFYCRHPEIESPVGFSDLGSPCSGPICYHGFNFCKHNQAVTLLRISVYWLLTVLTEYNHMS